MTIPETWKNIEEKGFDGFYQISNYGRVRSLDRRVVYSDGRVRFFKGKLLKLKTDKDGYKYVILKNRGKSKTLKVHRLVGQYFVPNPDNKPFINHLDEVKDNNVYTNLEWVTPSENYNYGTCKERAVLHHDYKKIGEKERNNVLKSKPIVMYKKVCEFPSIAEASRQTGIGENDIRNNLHNKQEFAGNNIFKFR